MKMRHIKTIQNYASTVRQQVRVHPVSGGAAFYAKALEQSQKRARVTIKTKNKQKSTEQTGKQVANTPQIWRLVIILCGIMSCCNFF